MFYLFSSDYATRYKRNVLDVLCYPEGQIFRFRYQADHVSSEIKGWGTCKSQLAGMLKKVGNKGVTIYAETTGTSPTKTFNFYPTREVEIIRIQVVGSVYYLDLKLGEFIDHDTELSKNSRPFQDTIKDLKFYPLPPLTYKTSPAGEQLKEKEGLTWYDDKEKPVSYDPQSKQDKQGFFFFYVSNDSTGLIKYDTGGLSRLNAWESIVNKLSSTTSMQDCVFYLVEGFYKVRRRWFIFGEREEYLINPKNNGWDTKYPLKMGESFVLKLLFYRSSKASPLGNQTLEIKTDGDAFAGFSQKEIQVLSRYNEERILVACKRIFDSVFAPIIIELKKAEKATSTDQSKTSTSEVVKLGGNYQLIPAAGEEPAKFSATLDLTIEPTAQDNKPTAKSDILAPQPFLLTQVTASKGLIILTLVLLVAASFFLFMSPDYVEQIGNSQIVQSRYKEIGDTLARNGKDFTSLSKVIGAVCTLCAGFLAFRKLPVGK
jgi:hypothetical protein